MRPINRQGRRQPVAASPIVSTESVSRDCELPHPLRREVRVIAAQTYRLRCRVGQRKCTSIAGGVRLVDG